MRKTLERTALPALAGLLLLPAAVCGGEAPEVSATAAAPVGRTSATFNGELSAGLDAVVTVRWGTDTNAWSSTNNVTVWTNVTPHRLSYAATGLTSGTEYGFQFHATNEHGFADSEVIAFTTVSAAAGFSGGAYDGYDEIADRHALDYPQVRNAAVGATNVTTISAWLNGMLLSTGSVAINAVRVYYGKTNGGTNVSAWATNHSFGVEAEMDPLTVNVAVDEGSTYYYRFYAIDTDSRVGWASASATFLTPAAPVVSIAAAAPVGRTSATLNGALTAGLTADITFNWGTDTNAWTYTHTMSGRAEGPLSLPVTGLTPGTTYSFKIAVENDYGDDDTAILEFTTVSETGGFSGGSYDGYDHVTGDGLVSAARGTLILLR